MRISIVRNFLIILMISLILAFTGYGQVVVTRPAIRPIPSPTPQVAIFRDDRGTNKIKIGPKTLGTGVAPAPLSAPEKDKILQSAVKDKMVATKLVSLPFATLTPRTAFIRDRAALNFFGAVYVYTSEYNQAGFLPGSSVAATVSIYPQKPGQWFMVDCSVETDMAAPQIFNMSVGSTKTELVVKGSGHIQALLATESLKWYELWIWADKSSWVLYGCEVNAAN